MTTIAMDEAELRELLVEREHLRNQVTQLQTRNTELVEERRKAAGDVLTMTRKSLLAFQVAMFSEQFGYPVSGVPYVPQPIVVRWRALLMFEETLEVLRALWMDAPDDIFDMMTNAFLALTQFVPVVDLPALAKELADLDFVNEGTRQAFGIPAAAVAAEVARANMAKTAPALSVEAGMLSEYGYISTKPLKPEGWKPPGIERILIQHGWRR